MNIEKLCEYLNDIGVLEYENVNKFLGTYSKINNDKNKSKFDKLKTTLFIYINNIFLKNNKLDILCQNIISSFANYQLILKYQNLNNIKNILQTKIHSRYNIFLIKLSFYIFHKLKDQEIKALDKIKEEKENLEEKKDKVGDLISSDDERECTFKPKINKNFKGYNKKKLDNIQSYVYYSPSFNITSKFPISNYSNGKNIINSNINSNSIKNIVNEVNNENNIMNSNYNNQFPTFGTVNNNIIVPQYNPNIIQKNPFQQAQINYNQLNGFSNSINNFSNTLFSSSCNNYNFSNNRTINNNNNYNNTYNVENFYNKELEHIQKVNNKINNLKFEKLNNIQEQCTFEPKINSNYKYIKATPIQSTFPKKNINKTIDENNNQDILNNDNNNFQKSSNEIKNNNDDINKKPDAKRSKSLKTKHKKEFRIMEDLSLARKKRTEKTKLLMKENNFTPKVNKNKFKIKMSFEERRQKSIDLKKKYRGEVHKYEFKKNKNEEEVILHPGELVRYKNKNDEDENNNTMKLNKTADGDFYNIKEDEIIRSSIKTEKKLNENENNNINGGDNNKDGNSNTDTIEKNKMMMMDKIMGEHKIGFKSNKNLGSALKIPEDKNLNQKNENKIENKDKDINGDVKNGNEGEEETPVDRYSFQNCEFHSKALKNLLNNNINENKN